MSSAPQDFVPLVRLVRGDVEESVHFGAVAVCDSDGRLLARAGNPDRIVMTRSALKPFQAVALVERGGLARWGLSAKELAIICASHNGEPMHVETVQGILGKLHLNESHLGCGVHEPAHTETWHDMIRRGEAPRAIHNNCSGKHSGMLALAQTIGADVRTYYAPENPTQQVVKRTVADMAGLPQEEMPTGTDGCNLVNIGMPQSKLALLYALLAEPNAAPAPHASALGTIFAAMCAHPEMVAGTGRFCTAFIRAGDGRWVSKAGAEGMYGIALPPPNPFSRDRGVGIVLKVADGDRSRSPQVPHEHGLKVQWLALGKILGDAGLLDENVKAHLEPFLEARRYNWRGAHVGFVEPVFELERSDG